MDIVVDGFGFMLGESQSNMTTALNNAKAFGDLTWVPFTYSLQARFLANHPNDLGMVGVFCIVALQLLGYYIFRVSNAEKNEFRTGNNPKSG